jgi:hypothetical protein
MEDTILKDPLIRLLRSALGVDVILSSDVVY